MPPVQSSYAENMAVAVVGQIGDMRPATLLSRTVETVAGIAFGVPVAQGTEDKGCILYAGAGYLGVTVRERSLDAAVPDKFAEKDNARIMTGGAVWVQASKAVDASDPVYITDAGAFTDTEGSNFLVPGARWETSTTDAGLALVSL